MSTFAFWTHAQTCLIVENDYQVIDFETKSTKRELLEIHFHCPKNNSQNITDSYICTYIHIYAHMFTRKNENNWKFLNKIVYAKEKGAVMYERKNKQFKIRVEEPLLNKFNERCKDCEYTKSQLVRCIMRKIANDEDGHKLFYRDDLMRKQLFYELRKIGINLNQIAYKLNIAIKSDDLSQEDRIEVEKSLGDVESIREEIKKMTQLMVKRF